MMDKRDRIALIIFATVLTISLMMEWHFRRGMEARFQEGLQNYFETLAPVPAPVAPAPPPTYRQPVPVPAPEPQTFPVVEDIAPAPVAVAYQNGAAPSAEPAVVAGRPVTEGQLEGPLI